jgi:subtilisin-like proprotein convertase family protein
MLTLVGLMAAALTPLYGCGSECADGTTDKDGECVVAANGCAEGTKLQGGECLLDTTGCADGTVFAEGECVPAEGSCSGDTTFDEGTLTCVPNTNIICGAGTEIGADGYCVPSAEACSDKTVFENGRCVIGAASCGEGTALDPTTGDCVLVAEGCGTGLAFDAESKTCVPTDQICDVGTKFDAESGLCLPDSCNTGDVVVEGICMTPAEDIARNPDMTETENNDPALGGTAETLIVNPTSDGAFTFVGAIGAPSDLDGDSELDQDVDVFEFEANAGEWFEIMVQSTGLQAPAFIVEGPNDFIRYSPMGRARDAAREIAVPADGTYSVTVLPSLVLQSGGEVNLIGGDDWTYVGSLNAIDPPAATDVDLSSGAGQFSGDYPGLTDNLFSITGLNAGELISLKFDTSGEDTDAMVMVFDATGVLTHTEPAASGSRIEFVAAGSSASVLLDWTMIDGPLTDFEVSAANIGFETTTTMQPGDVVSFQLTAAVDDQIVASHTNTQSADLNVTIVEDLTATELAADATLGSGEALMPLVTTPGTYTVNFTNDSGSNVDATMIAKIRPPFAFGMLNSGDRASTGTFQQNDGGMTYVTFSVGAGQMIEIYHDNDQGDDHDFELYDDQGTEVEYDSYFYPLSYTYGPDFMYYLSEQGGAYRLEVEGRDDVTNEEIFVNTDVPTAVNLPTVGSTETRTRGAMYRDQRQWYLVDVGEEGKLKINGQSGNGEDIDLYVYDLSMSSLWSTTSSGGIDETRDVNPGQFLVAIEADYAIDSFQVTVELLAPPPPPQHVSAPSVAIPNDTTTPVSDTLTASGCASIGSVDVFVDITHGYEGDLTITLTSPAGTSVLLEEYTGLSSITYTPSWYPIDRTPVDSLSTLAGENGDGDWTLTVLDEYDWVSSSTDDGTLNDWGITLTCP